MKILLGGIPLGCNNIGDEAIIECVVKIFREVFPTAELTVCTQDMAKTAQLLNVSCVPLYGFAANAPLANFAKAVKDYNLFVWAGATGLSDYPATGCELLEAAGQSGVRTIIWNVGMNDTFNPAFFQLGGTKAKLCRVVQRLLGLDLKIRWEARLTAKIRKRLGLAVAQCSLVVLRDAESLKNLYQCNPGVNGIVGADSAIIQESAAALPWDKDDSNKFHSFKKRIGLCISAQSAIKEMDEFISWMDKIGAENPDLLWVMIPMNPQTDYTLMASMAAKMKCQKQLLLTRFIEPAEVQLLAGECQLIISSRLHLIILGLNRLVPAIGIGRGSKVRVFLDPFELPLCGETNRIDFAQMSVELHKYLECNNFTDSAMRCRQEMLTRLDNAKKLLALFSD